MLQLPGLQGCFWPAAAGNDEPALSQTQSKLGLQNHQVYFMASLESRVPKAAYLQGDLACKTFRCISLLGWRLESLRLHAYKVPSTHMRRLKLMKELFKKYCLRLQGKSMI